MIFVAFYVIIATHCHFNVVNLYIYHCILVFLHSSVDSWRELDENVQSKTAFFKATHMSKSGKDSSDAIESYFKKVLLRLKCLIFLELFVWHLSRNRENGERRKMSGYRKKLSCDWLEKYRWERHLCTTFKLRTRFFCQQRARLEVLIKVTLLKKT